MKIEKNKKYTLREMEILYSKARKIYNFDDSMEFIKKFGFTIVIDDKGAYCIIKD